MAIQDPRNFFLNGVEDRLSAADELVLKHGRMLKERAKEINAKKKRSPAPPEPEPSEEEDVMRPKDRMKGAGAMPEKRESPSKMMDLEDDVSTASERTPEAKLVAEDELMQSFFAKAHGGSFDPNSRVDKAKMQKILDMVNSDPKLMSLTPGKFAVKLYASK